jgi:hypothetical protein
MDMSRSNRRTARALIIGATAFVAALAQTGPLYASPRTVPSTPAPRPVQSTDVARIMADSAARRTIPLWSGAATHQGVTYPYQMVGKSPLVHQRNPRVIVDTPVVSVIWHFPDGTTSDPTKPTGCGASTSLSPRQLVAGSPVFTAHPYSSGGVFVGRGQYVDEFQRANLWRAIQSTANRSYSVRLRGSFSRVVDLTPAQTALFKPVTDPYGHLPCGHLWGVDAFAVDNYLQRTLIPSLHLRPDQFPIFLGSNIFGYVGQPGLFDVIGNHGSYIDAQGLLQTYAEVDYDTTGFMAPDVSVLAHEVGEWMDNPLNDNHVPTITGLGCQTTPPAGPNSLEVGDPLEYANVTVGPMPNGVTYHPQDLAFASWFYDEVPSRASNPGSYSFNGTFRTDAAATPSCF